MLDNWSKSAMNLIVLVFVRSLIIGNEKVWFHTGYIRIGSKVGSGCCHRLIGSPTASYLLYKVIIMQMGSTGNLLNKVALNCANDEHLGRLILTQKHLCVSPPSDRTLGNQHQISISYHKLHESNALNSDTTCTQIHMALHTGAVLQVLQVP